MYALHAIHDFKYLVCMWYKKVQIWYKNIWQLTFKLVFLILLLTKNTRIPLLVVLLYFWLVVTYLNCQENGDLQISQIEGGVPSLISRVTSNRVL